MNSSLLISDTETFFDTIKTEIDQNLLRKFYLLTYSYYKGNSYYKNYWLPKLTKDLETINRKKNKLVKRLWLRYILFGVDNLVNSKLEDFCKKESILTLEILKIGFIEIEFLCNLILALNMKNVKLMKERISEGNSDGTKLRYSHFIKNKKLLRWFKKIYDVKLLEEYNLDEREKETISEIYEYELEFIEDFFKLIPKYKDFTYYIRNVLSHTHSYILHKEALHIDNLEYFRNHGLLALIYRDIGDKKIVEKTHTGYFFVNRISWYISGILRLQEVLLRQILWYCKYEVKIIHGLVSDKGKEKEKIYFQIWKRLGFWGKRIGPTELREEEFGLDKSMDKDPRFQQQKKLLEEIEILMKKYPSNSSDMM